MPIKVMTVGLGPIGAGIVRQMAARKTLQLVAAVDRDPEKIGRDAGDVCGLARRLRVKVTGDIRRTARASRPDVAVLCTGSSLRAVLPEFEEVLREKLPIVSTTEELAYPTRGNTAAAKKIDALAKRARVAVLGTGVNPGYVMDLLPIVLTAPCERIEAVAVERVQDARIRRVPFQQKIGAGLTPEIFAEQVKAGRIRHVGLTESITMIADAVGWKLDRVTDDVQPKLATAAVSGAAVPVEPGQVAGIVQDGVGWRRGVPLVRLHMEAYVGAPTAYDRIMIEGLPRLSVTIEGGLHGDIATAALVVNSIPKVLQAPPGLRTMRDMVAPSYYGR